MPQLSKKNLEEVLAEALLKLHQRTGKDTFHAAPLAVEITEVIHQRTGDRNLVFGPEIYGQALFQKEHFTEGNSPKFRDFLRQFPDQVELVERYNGDLVRWLKAPKSKVDAEHWKSLVREIIETGGASTSAASISCSKLAILLRRIAPDFDQKKLGFESFHDLLKSWPDLVEFTTVLGGGRVRLRKSTALAAEELASTHSKSTLEPAYLLVDGEDLRNRVHDLVGAKPAQTQYPDWTKVPQWVQNKFPARELKCRYFTASGPTVAPSMEAFVHYLTQINFMVRSTPVILGPDQETNRLRRTQQVSAELIKMLEALVPLKASVFVVSHRPEIAPALKELIKAHPGGSFAALGFWEFFPDEFKELASAGLRLFDLVHDVHSIPDPLPRKLSSLASGFDPNEYL